jgi:hypothetical protein
MSDAPDTHEGLQRGETVSRLDSALLLAAFTLTIVGNVLPEDSKARYAVAGAAALAYLKGAHGFVKAEASNLDITDPEQEPEILQQYNSFGEL